MGFSFRFSSISLRLIEIYYQLLIVNSMFTVHTWKVTLVNNWIKYKGILHWNFINLFFSPRGSGDILITVPEFHREEKNSTQWKASVAKYSEVWKQLTPYCSCGVFQVSTRPSSPRHLHHIFRQVSLYATGTCQLTWKLAPGWDATVDILPKTWKRRHFESNWTVECVFCLTPQEHNGVCFIWVGVLAHNMYL